MLKRLHITNYRSIADATVELQPFTILVGANGSGKSNLLKLLVDLSAVGSRNAQPLSRHFADPTGRSGVRMTTTADQSFEYWDVYTDGRKPIELESVSVFTIDPGQVAGTEQLVSNPTVKPNGFGAIQVLDSLKTGDHEDLFDVIEQQLCEFVPEIQKLSFAPSSSAKSLQVREAGIASPVPVSQLSEGTRLVLTILTIVHQERRPSIICLEDLDRGLHPALFGKVVEVCRTLVRTPGAPQIIATTHNPYLVDQFVDDEDSVVIVEKTDAKTSFTTLGDRLGSLDTRSDTLGAIWYSGLVGGVPRMPVRHLPRAPRT